MPTSATRGETLTPHLNECNSTLTSGTNNIYPYPIDINDRGHRFRSGSPLTNYPNMEALAFRKLQKTPLPFPVDHLDSNFPRVVHSLSSGKGKMFLCAACHAFTLHVNAWKN